MSQDLLVIETSLDQPAPLPKLPDVLDRVQKILEISLKKKSPSVALDAVGRMIEANRLSGWALAYLFLGLHRRWEELGMSGALVDEIHARWGMAPDTVRRYIMAADMRERQKNDKIKEAVGRRPIRDVIAVAQAENKGGRFTEKQLERILKSEDTSTLRKTIKIVRGESIEENDRLILRLRRDTGIIEAWKGDNESNVGVLMINKEDNALRTEAIQRIIETAGIIIQ